MQVAQGGAATVTLIENELPRHTHKGLFWSHPDDEAYNVTLDSGTAAYMLSWSGQGGSVTNGKGRRGEYEFRVGQTGQNAAHNNMPPYLAVYVFQRTA